MAGKFGEFQGEVRAAIPPPSADLAAMGREVAALAEGQGRLLDLVEELGEAQRRTMQVAEGTVRTRLEIQMAMHVEAMADLAGQAREQHQALGTAVQELATWTRQHDQAVARLGTLLAGAASRAGSLGSALEAQGDRLAAHERAMAGLRQELATRQREGRRGRAIWLLGLVLLAVLAAAALIALPMMGLHPIPR